MTSSRTLQIALDDRPDVGRIAWIGGRDQRTINSDLIYWRDDRRPTNDTNFYLFEMSCAKKDEQRMKQLSGCAAGRMNLGPAR
jgi:hypothetical protein